MSSDDEAQRAQTAEEKRWVEDLIRRGEAAERGKDGELPPGATHEIVERREDGTVRVERRRFSAA
jgi:hypothetical protein